MANGEGMSTVLDKRRERKQIPRNLVLRSKWYVHNKFMRYETPDPYQTTGVATKLG